jgi:predicted nucleotide-binding protein
LAFSPGLPIFYQFPDEGFQSHHKEDCVFNAHAQVAVELSVLAINLGGNAILVVILVSLLI